LPIASSAAVASVASERDRRPRIPELDGLRGLAIALVLFYHYFLAPFNIAPALSFPIFSFRAASRGAAWIFFFVLSGFLIGGILLDAKESTNYFKVFYIRRFFRIAPIYAVLLLSFCGGPRGARRLGPVHIFWTLGGTMPSDLSALYPKLFGWPRRACSVVDGFLPLGRWRWKSSFTSRSLRSCGFFPGAPSSLADSRHRPPLGLPSRFVPSDAHRLARQ